MLEGLTDIGSGDAIVAGLDVKTEPYEVKQRIGVQLQRMNISITCTRESVRQRTDDAVHPGYRR